jgi:uncharacterized protein (TIRG00374 family)
MSAEARTSLKAWGSATRKHLRTIVHWAVMGVAVGVLATQMPKLSQDLELASVPLRHLRWHWVFLAVLTALGGLALYGEMHRQLLLVGGSRVPILSIQAITFGENAISNTVPVVGGAGALVYAIDQLRRYRVDTALASWAILLAGVVDTLALVDLGILGLGWARHVPLFMVLLAIVVVSLGAAGCWYLLTHPVLLRHGLHALLVVTSRIPGGCPSCKRAWAGRAEEGARRLSGRIAMLRPTKSRWLALILLVLSSWLLDFCTLLLASAAVDTAVPVSVLIEGFLIVQTAIALQIFPGGAGLAAVGLLGVMVASGAPVASAAATTLVYRLISWFGLAALGWVVYAVRIHAGRSFIHRHPPEHTSA